MFSCSSPRPVLLYCHQTQVGRERCCHYQARPLCTDGPVPWEPAGGNRRLPAAYLRTLRVRTLPVTVLLAPCIPHTHLPISPQRPGPGMLCTRWAFLSVQIPPHWGSVTQTLISAPPPPGHLLGSPSRPSPCQRLAFSPGSELGSSSLLSSTVGHCP